MVTLKIVVMNIKIDKQEQVDYSLTEESVKRQQDIDTMLVLSNILDTQKVANSRVIELANIKLELILNRIK